MLSVISTLHLLRFRGHSAAGNLCFRGICCTFIWKASQVDAKQKSPTDAEQSLKSSYGQMDR